MAIASYGRGDPGRAEVAVVVRDDFQGQGVGSHLLSLLEKIAMKNNYKGFTASVLVENTGMIHVFKKRYPNMKVEATGGEVFIDMSF